MTAPPAKARIKVDGQDAGVEFTPNRYSEAALLERMPSKYRRLHLGQAGSTTLFGNDNIVADTVELYNDLSLNDTTMEASDRKPPLFLTITASKHALMETEMTFLIEDVDAADDHVTRERRLRNLFDRFTNILQCALNTAVKSDAAKSSYNFNVTSARGGVVRVVAGDVVKFAVCMLGSHLPKDVDIKVICKKPDSYFGDPKIAPIVKLMVWGKGGAAGLGSSMITNNPDLVSSRWCCFEYDQSGPHCLSLSLYRRSQRSTAGCARIWMNPWLRSMIWGNSPRNSGSGKAAAEATALAATRIGTTTKTTRGRHTTRHWPMVVMTPTLSRSVSSSF